MIGWIGIDPGNTGAIAAILSDGRVLISDLSADERDVWSAFSGMEIELVPELVVVEKQASRPAQSAPATFGAGRNYGFVLMACAAMRWPMHLVAPDQWKKKIGGYPAKARALSKSHSIVTARRLYPQAAHLLTRAKDDGRAEALLLAHCARNITLKGEMV